MKWLKITVVFFLVTLVKCGPTRSEVDDDPAGLNIKKIERTAKRTKQKEDTFKFTLEGTPTKPVQKYLLEVFSGGVPEDPVASDDPLEKQSLSFTTNLDSYYGQKANFLITGWVDEKTIGAYADVEVANFPKFPEVSASQAVSNVEGLPSDNILLRVEGNLGTMTIAGSDTYVANKVIQYLSFTSTPSYIPCGNTKGVPVCDVDLNPTSAPATKGDLKSVILSYINATAATIKISFNDNAKTVNIPIQDVIVSSDGGITNKLFNKEESCDIGGTFPGTVTHNIIIVKEKKIDQPPTDEWTTNNVALPDRELIATILGNNIIEGRWKILSDVTKTTENPVYVLRKTIDGKEQDPTDDIEVDCSHLVQTYCFGYFPNLDSDTKYTLIVASKTSPLPSKEYNKMQQVESLSKTTPKTSELELAILSRHMTRHANQLTADVNICFQHLTPPEGGAFSHYEMLIINEKGQWLKHRILEEEEGEGEEVSEGRLCFAPFTINTKDFDLTEGTKVVISQRGVDGVTVLATGESKLL